MSFADLSIEVSQDLFNNIQRSHHCLNHLLPACRPLDTLQPSIFVLQGSHGTRLSYHVDISLVKLIWPIFAGYYLANVS